MMLHIFLVSEPGDSNYFRAYIKRETFSLHFQRLNSLEIKVEKNLEKKGKTMEQDIPLSFSGSKQICTVPEMDWKHVVDQPKLGQFLICDSVCSLSLIHDLHTIRPSCLSPGQAFTVLTDFQRPCFYSSC